MTSSFAEAERFDAAYYHRMTPTQRLEIMQWLREQFKKFGKRRARASRKGLRGSLRIIQQA